MRKSGYEFSQARALTFRAFLNWSGGYEEMLLIEKRLAGRSIRNVTPTAERFVVTARITIPCLEGGVWREATGTEDEELRGYGDPSSNAEAMALKRAAAKFGLGLYLYQK